MSLEEFWINVRTAGQGGDPQLLNRYPFDECAVRDSLRRRTDWRTEETVEGFDLADFAFLDEPARRDLTEAVADFKAAIHAGSREEQAIESFLRVLQLVEFPRFGNPEGFRLGKLIDRQLGLNLPEFVDDFRVDAGTDHTDDPALFIWVFIKGGPEDPKFFDNARVARERIGGAVLKVIRDEAKKGKEWTYYTRIYSVGDRKPYVALSVETRSA